MASDGIQCQPPHPVPNELVEEYKTVDLLWKALGEEGPATSVLRDGRIYSCFEHDGWMDAMAEQAVIMMEIRTFYSEYWCRVMRKPPSARASYPNVESEPPFQLFRHRREYPKDIRRVGHACVPEVVSCGIAHTPTPEEAHCSP